MDMLPVKPERKAELDDYAKRHGQDVETALNDVLADYFAWERQEYAEAVEGIREGIADMEAGRVMPAKEAFEKLRVESMAFRVDITEQAYQDLGGILRWLLSEQAGESGLHWYYGLVSAIDTLNELPQRCPKAPENRTSRREIRQLLYGSKPHVYRVLFTIQDDVVTVVHVRRPKQDTLSLH